MRYIVAIKKTKYGYDVHIPALPGCHSQGQTKKEALRNIRDAVVTYLDMAKSEFKDTEFKEMNFVLA